ncbi:MAG: hypothetical protein PHN59_06070 [Candidatus Omnitrophica bacterium]|nr:hypothetical protein [Candidatus Omnitrophota bacterium]
MKVTIHTAFERLFEDQASEVVLPGEDGEFSVWDFHQPCLYSLRRGWLRVIPRRGSKENEYRLLIKRGVAKVDSRSLVIIAEK